MALYKECRGSGTPLLMIHGIISDGSFFQESAVLLEQYYQVITYDRRGYGRSRNETYSDFSIHTQAEDAAVILRECCDQPAIIYGNSAGGLIAMDLAIHHPELVRSMILLEPSLGYDDESCRLLSQWNQELNTLVKNRKIKRALPLFAQTVGGDSSAQTNASLAEMKQTYQNLETFMYGELNEVQNHLPTLEACKALEMPIAVGVTEDGRDTIFATSSLKGAEIIGWPVVMFPGRHNVARDLPDAFVKTLEGILEPAAVL